MEIISLHYYVVCFPSEWYFVFSFSFFRDHGLNLTEAYYLRIQSINMSLFPFSEHFFVPFPFSLFMESVPYVLSFRMMFFLPCDHGLDF